MKRDNRKILHLSCAWCQGSGAIRGERCLECRGKGQVRTANPFYVPPGEVPTWFQLGGGEGWAREVRRLLNLGDCRCWSGAQSRHFRAICARLEAWRIHSAVHCNSIAIAAIAPLVEEAFRRGGSLERPGSFSADTGWTTAQLGEMLVEVRNRQVLWSLGRMAARVHGPRFDAALIPDDRLDALIQRHPSIELVDRLRDERSRRFADRQGIAA